ncbi:putative MFS monocarboxylate transporter [Aspergillus clavatus NRRL 1]|uniref:MFS monocarboxylate transporter, putative n=1 Tax=Aspergillus clavatus (strain ATCC 1007 / CBS 513.65 / DSM 816 / NCTC 3887 / NRRL 1 / QM 1276 / 107) TaxID=344612 RepID=A1CCR2_ASPCL|nr:MFS monocarboxylate transporter, putative [Aspergillus clavatus NRRL 1]EAW12319.1 MFS monocarboxylate transporter, putative [Aspergillus clavatus NRRL 1]
MATKELESFPPALCKETLSHTPTTSDESSSQLDEFDESLLPPVDGGYQAWLFLVACFMVEGIVWGFAQSFGVFETYYRTHEPFSKSNEIAAIGTCAMGMAYLPTPIIIAVMFAFPRARRWFSTAGFVLMSLALGLGSFSQNVTHLVMSQGVAYGIGGCLAYTPSILFMSDWFVKKKGLAFGIVWSGSGLTGIIFPLILQALLNRYGWQTTLRACSVTLFILAAPFMAFHKPRTPLRHSNLNQLSLRFLWNRVYLIYQLGNTMQALGFWIPSIFLTSYARSLGTSDFLASLTVTLFNLMTVFGCVFTGYMADRHHVTKCILVSSTGAVVSVFLLWGFATHLALLYVFCIVYGFFAGGYSSSWSALTHEVQKSERSAHVSMVFAFLETGRGVGNVVSGPLSEAFLKMGVWKGTALGAYGTEYGVLVVFTGVTALLGGFASFARLMKWV